LNYTSELVGIEEITVPAGTFTCYHLTQEYEVIYGTVTADIWYSPEIRMYPKIDAKNLPFGLGDIVFEMASIQALM